MVIWALQDYYIRELISLRIRPIPKQLLIHSIVYEEYIGRGGFGDTWKPSETIENVFVEPQTKLFKTANNQEVQLQAIIYLDAENTPKFKELKENSKITFGSMIGKVFQCKAFYTPKNANIPHHYEIMVG